VSESGPFCGRKKRHIAQGEFAVGDGSGGSITTILGSCVTVCLHDPVAHLGGMNHFLLPEGSGAGVQPACYGVNAMELLINALTKHGAMRGRLQAKAFGGARMVAGLSDIGASNTEFVLDFLQREGMECVSRSLGGCAARRVEFWPESGRARQLLLHDLHLREAPPDAPHGDDIELF